MKTISDNFKKIGERTCVCMCVGRENGEEREKKSHKNGEMLEMNEWLS